MTAIVAASAVIVIVVSPPPPAAEHVAALEAACSDAARPRTCEVHDEASTERADVEVRWVGASEVTLEHTPGTPAEPGTLRRLSFRPGDGVRERYRAIGLVAASFLSKGSADGRQEGPSSPSSPHDGWIGVSGMLGRGLDPGSLRYGAGLRAGYRPFELPLFGTGAVHSTTAGETPGGARPGWTAFQVGAGAVMSLAAISLDLRPRVELGLEHLTASVEDKRETGGGSRWLFGAGAGVEVIWPSTSPLALAGDVSSRLLTGGTALRVRDEKDASFPAFGYTFALGIELRLPP